MWDPPKQFKTKSLKHPTWCSFPSLFGAVLETLKGCFSNVKHGSPSHHNYRARTGSFHGPSGAVDISQKRLPQYQLWWVKWWGRQIKNWWSQESCHGHHRVLFQCKSAGLHAIMKGNWFFSLTIRYGRYFTKMSAATQAEMSEVMKKTKQVMYQSNAITNKVHCSLSFPRD